MRKLLVMLSLAWACALLMPGRAGASGTIQPGFTYQTGVSSITTNIISVSTSVTTGASQMDNPQVANRVVTEIQNIDTSANLWCLAISTNPTVSGGRKIAAGASWIVSVMDNLYQINYSSTTGQTPSTLGVKFWCLSDGAAATKAAVTQMY